MQAQIDKPRTHRWQLAKFSSRIFSRSTADAKIHAWRSNIGRGSGAFAYTLTLRSLKFLLIANS
jgi:hypothetical protein